MMIMRMENEPNPVKDDTFDWVGIVQWIMLELLYLLLDLWKQRKNLVRKQRKYILLEFCCLIIRMAKENYRWIEIASNKYMILCGREECWLNGYIY